MAMLNNALNSAKWMRSMSSYVVMRYESVVKQMSGENEPSTTNTTTTVIFKTNSTGTNSNIHTRLGLLQSIGIDRLF